MMRAAIRAQLNSTMRPVFRNLYSLVETATNLYMKAALVFIMMAVLDVTSLKLSLVLAMWNLTTAFIHISEFSE